MVKIRKICKSNKSQRRSKYIGIKYYKFTYFPNFWLICTNFLTDLYQLFKIILANFFTNSYQRFNLFLQSFLPFFIEKLTEI